jgi:hypothetical protein
MRSHNDVDDVQNFPKKPEKGRGLFACLDLTAVEETDGDCRDWDLRVIFLSIALFISIT